LPSHPTPDHYFTATVTGRWIRSDAFTLFPPRTRRTHPSSLPKNTLTHREASQSRPSQRIPFQSPPTHKSTIPNPHHSTLRRTLPSQHRESNVSVASKRTTRRILPTGERQPTILLGLTWSHAGHSAGTSLSKHSKTPVRLTLLNPFPTTVHTHLFGRHSGCDTTTAALATGCTGLVTRGRLTVAVKRGRAMPPRECL